MATALGFIVLLAQSFRLGEAYDEQRELQSSIWNRIPGFENRTAIPDSPCDALAWVFETQIQQDGYVCECTEDSDIVTLTCTRDEVQCDDLEGVQDAICHTNKITVSTTKGGFLSLDPKQFDISACADYNVSDRVPDWLLKREICLVYSISIGLTGMSLNECGVTFENLIGRPEKVCTCSVCDGNTAWEMGLGFDCQADIFGAVIFQECIPITTFSLVAFPLITNVDEENTPPPLDITQAPSSSKPPSDGTPSSSAAPVTQAPSVPVDGKPTQAPSSKPPSGGTPSPSGRPATENPGAEDSAGMIFVCPLLIAFITIVATSWMMN